MRGVISRADLVGGHLCPAGLAGQRADEHRVARQLGRQRHSLPVVPSVGRAQQDRRLAHNPALLAVEGDGVEAVVEACTQQTGSSQHVLNGTQRCNNVSPCSRSSALDMQVACMCQPSTPHRAELVQIAASYLTEAAALRTCQSLRIPHLANAITALSEGNRLQSYTSIAVWIAEICAPSMPFCTSAILPA